LRIYVLGRMFFRRLLFWVILLLALPLLHYYADVAVNPLEVQYQKPRGDALKVYRDWEQAGQSGAWWEQLREAIRHFYQSGF